MKTKLNILLAFYTVLAVLTFSSATVCAATAPVKKEKTTASSEKDKKEDKTRIVEFDALLTASASFVPVHVVTAWMHILPVVIQTETNTGYVESTSQEFFRIFFTHIISKNAP